MKNPSETECLAADSDSLICESQYDADDRALNLFRLDALETSDRGVSLLPCALTDRLALVSEIGVMLPTAFGTEPTVDLAGTESLLGGLPAFSLPDRSRTLTLLLVGASVLPLEKILPIK